MKKESSLVFLVHGFMGHPDEFDPLVEVLHQEGFDTHRFSLPAHGSVAGNLGSVTWEEMVYECQKELFECHRHYKTVHLLGFSLGGALSLALYNRHPESFESLTLVASPYKNVFNLAHGQYHLKNFFNRFLPGTQYLFKGNTGLPKPFLMPSDMLRFYQQMEILFEHARVAAAQVTIPTLLLHSPYDITVPYEHSEWYYDTIPGKPKFVTLMNCGHQIFPFHSEGLVTDSIVQHCRSAGNQRTAYPGEESKCLSKSFFK